MSAFRRKSAAEGPSRHPGEVQDGPFQESSSVDAFVWRYGVDTYGRIEGVSNGATLVSWFDQWCIYWNWLWSANVSIS